MRPLLILDLDETLIYASEAPLDRPCDFMVGPFFAYERPGLANFLAAMREHFELAVWTSSSAPYAALAVAAIFDLPPVFLWARERCTWRYFPESQGGEWTKNLSMLKRYGYQLERVLMVDDTPSKLAKHYGNLVRVAPYFGATDDRELPALAAYLPALAAAGNVRRIEKRGWRTSL